MAWFNEGCDEGNAWCDGADFTFDSFVNRTDLEFFADCWLEADTRAPLPNPAEWLQEPYSASDSQISMEAEHAYDAWGWDVAYYFECITDSNFDSGWQSEPTYTRGGLSLGTELCFRVKAADELGYETAFSVGRCAIVSGVTPEPDTTPPSGNLGFEIIEANSPTSVHMQASTMFDASGVEYYFDCYSGECNDSNWQDEPNYTDVNLVPETEYCYRLMVRDKSPQQNATDWSDVECVVTQPSADTTPPTPDPMEWDPTEDANGFDGTPRKVCTGVFDCNAVMRATPEAADESGYIEFYFECRDNHDYDSGWIYFSATPYEYSVPVGVASGWRWRVKARDAYNNQTAWSEEAAM
jgi:hypothetical protein